MFSPLAKPLSPDQPSSSSTSSWLQHASEPIDPASQLVVDHWLVRIANLPSATSVGWGGRTLLHMACAQGRLDVCEWFRLMLLAKEPNAAAAAAALTRCVRRAWGGVGRRWTLIYIRI